MPGPRGSLDLRLISILVSPCAMACIAHVALLYLSVASWPALGRSLHTARGHTGTRDYRWIEITDRDPTRDDDYRDG